MTTAEKREAARLRSERYRRRHGIGPRRPAQKPWLSEGVSRSTWYRRGGKIGWQRDQATNQRGVPESLYRAESFTRRLQRELLAAAGHMTVSASILREFPLVNGGGLLEKSNTYQ